jgi:hypothetical protein
MAVAENETTGPVAGAPYLAVHLLTVLVLTHTHAQAQPATGLGVDLSAGARIRVTVASQAEGGHSRLVGTLAGWDGGELRLASSVSGTRVLQREALLRLERSVSPSRRSTGALIGFGVGLAAVVGKAAVQGGCNDGCRAENVVEALLVAASGATLGALVSPGEQWQDVAMSHPSTRSPSTGKPGPWVRLVPQLGRRTGLTVVASF